MIIFKEHDDSHGAGFCRLPHRLEKGIIYVLYGIFFAAALRYSGASIGADLLLIPAALALAVYASLRFRLVAVLITTVMNLVLALVFFYLQRGLFEVGLLSSPIAFICGIVLLFFLVTTLVAIVTGYHLQSCSIASQQQHMLHKIFDALPIGIWVRARSGETVYLNDQWANFSSSTKQEIIASPSAKAPVNLGTLWARSALAVLNDEDGVTQYQTVELTDQKGQSSILNLLTLRIFIDQLNDYGILCLMVDETVVRDYQDKIRMSENSLRLALDNANMGFWDQELGTSNIVCDENWCHILGLDPKADFDLLEVWKERIHPDDSKRVNDAYSKFFEDAKGVVRIDYRIRKGESEYLWVQDYVGVVERNVDGSIKRIMGTMQDITEHKQNETDLLQAKELAEAASEAKGQFIATISHEIRTPLNAIIGLSSFLADSEMSEDQLDLAQTIYSSGNSLLMLVNDILDFSKIESGRLDLEVQEYPIRLCFEECIKLFAIRANEKHVSLALRMDDSIPEFAIGDMERLRQIVQNLLSNALKFTDAGSVEISVSLVELEDIPEDRRPRLIQPVDYLDHAEQHTYLQVLVKDSGMGIPVDRQHMLFKAFSQVDASMTRKHGGTGLGLVICKRLVDGMGGNIWLQSEEGEGSVFGFVVRTELIDNDEYVKNTANPFDSEERISEEHPCDILIVGPAEDTATLLNCCRQLGYFPHSCQDYDLSSGAYIRRQYNIIFVWMGDEAIALNLCRQISADAGIKKTATIVGYAPQGREVSIDRCKLSGLGDVMDSPIGTASLTNTILSVLGERD
ncbi:MAG: ATP-binding protein [Opitutaceae bacterium]